MTCPRCQIDFNSLHWGGCPHCGAPSGVPDSCETVIKTSTILISTSDGGIFNSIDDVPERLRSNLAACTTGPNSATIVIADRAGRDRISAALKALPFESSPRGRSASAVGRDLEHRLRSRPALMVWAGLALAGFSGIIVWFAISHLK